MLVPQTRAWLYGMTFTLFLVLCVIGPLIYACYRYKLVILLELDPEASRTGVLHFEMSTT